MKVSTIFGNLFVVQEPLFRLDTEDYMMCVDIENNVTADVIESDCICGSGGNWDGDECTVGELTENSWVPDEISF